MNPLVSRNRRAYACEQAIHIARLPVTCTVL